MRKASIWILLSLVAFWPFASALLLGAAQPQLPPQPQQPKLPQQPKQPQPPQGPLLPEPVEVQVDVFVSGKDGYHTFRIPAIEAAPDGTLLAFAEARKYSMDDPGFGKQDIDLVLKRSTDNGLTWSSMKVIEDPGELWSAANAATAVNRKDGRVWLLYLRSRPERSTETSRPETDDTQTIARSSSDCGATWSEPIDLTKIARDFSPGTTWKASVVGPGGGIQDRKGRLIFPVWKVEPPGVLAIFSEDGGGTWKRGDLVPGKVGGDENQLVEVSDGRILMDYRQREGGHRWMAVSSDGGRTWSEPKPGLDVSPVCCAIERWTSKSSGDDRDRILWTGPKGPERNNLVIRLSYDEGQTFPNERMLYRGPAAYSDLTILKDRSVGVFFERGQRHAYEYLSFARFQRKFLEPEK